MNINELDLTEVRKHIIAGKKINAIKALRDQTAIKDEIGSRQSIIGLREAKGFVEGMPEYLQWQISYLEEKLRVAEGRSLDLRNELHGARKQVFSLEQRIVDQEHAHVVHTHQRLDEISETQMAILKYITGGDE